MAGTNNNSSVVVVGRTAPVPPGQQTSQNSVPVVIASDQTAIPVEEQNKQQSEVALSLLGIPRSEVALGIFADVNTYDVNPTEWSQFPEQFTSAEIYRTDDNTALRPKYINLIGDADWGLTHIAEEAGAMIEAPADEYSILTSKRFFRYQPGRVSAATFGVKLTRAPYTVTNDADTGEQIKNPSIKKYGIFDKFDGYYFESKNDGYGDNFSCVRRTQSIIRQSPLPFGGVTGAQDQDYAWVGIPQIESNAATYPVAYEVIKANKRYLQEIAADNVTTSGDKPKCRRDAGLMIEGVLHDLKYGGNASTVYNTLRFFDTESTPGTISLYIQSGTGPKTANDELERYDLVLTAITSVLAGNPPIPTSYPAVGDSELIIPVLPSDLGIPASGLGAIEAGASAAVTNLLENIFLRALGKFDEDYNYSSIPTTPTGSAAGEMAILRDGLVMIHGAANDPSLLKETVDYQIVSIVIGDSGTKYLKVKVPAGKELLQVGQSISFQANGLDVDLRDDDDDESVLDGSIWHVTGLYDAAQSTTYNAALPRNRVESQTVYQYVGLSKYPTNEEIYVAGNDSNPWVDNTTKAYTDAGQFILNSIRQDGAVFNIGSSADTETGEDAAVVALGITLRTPTAFILAGDDRTYAGRQYTDESRPSASGFPAQFVDGSFPYVYPPGQASASNSKGYIDSVYQDTSDIKRQINYVNKRLYKNWVWFNVDPRYYKVYEYRVPRSRMSGEKLNGVETDVIYSDNVLDKLAGAPVLDPVTQEQLTFDSVWDLDPTKVTMYKIEFSWYGAVGATFLAYVPIENNEARWVRVHHLRASNQLKVASLGNATLPITYLAYGGGNENAYGYLNADRRLNSESGYGSTSEQLTKYGASYYIDGGDRGTVRLFSYASETLKEIGGSRYVFDSGVHTFGLGLGGSASNASDATPGTGYVNAPYLQFNIGSAEFFGAGDPALENKPPISDYYQDARVITSDPTDQDVRVTFVDQAQARLYLSRTLNAASGDISLIVKRPQPLVGIKCRTEINGVRNRVQIYPTRLATGLTSNSESLAVELIKTPIFQTFTDPNGTFAINNTDGVNIGNRGKRILLDPADITESGGVGTYIQPGEKLYGWFRYTILGSPLAFTILGLLERTSTGSYYFSANDVTIDDVYIKGTFLPAGRWGGPTGDSGTLPATPINPDLSGVTSPFPTATLNRLSAIETDTEQRTPIPGTGTVVTTIFSPNSGEEYELSPYFDYNKDYLSFPLTDIQETLYVCASSKSTYLQGTNYTARGNILASITWEEQ